MCTIDWALWPDWITAISSLLTLVVAAIALGAWRVEARGSAAHDVIEAAWELRYAFYGARSVLIEGWEFPDGYWERKRAGSLTNSYEADALWHVYRQRLEAVWPSLNKVVGLRAKCGAVFGDEAADSCHKLAIAARHLRLHMEEAVAVVRAGDAAKDWSDQAFVKEVRENLLVAPGSRDDKLSREFEAAFDALPKTLKRPRRR
jgi:hypothetical protein